MFGSWVLEVAIGLIFVFLLFSTICAAVREGIESWTKTRAAYLERGIRELLNDTQGKGLARTFYEHPLIFSLYGGGYEPVKAGEKPGTLDVGGTLPSYIPAKNFAAALIDIAARGALPLNPPPPEAGAPPVSTGPITVASLRAGIGKIQNERVERAMLNAFDLAGDDLDKVRRNLEAWYDSGMDRVSGWYRRSTQKIVFLLALAIAGIMNVDAIGIANFLYRNDNARHAVVAQAEAAVADVRAAEAGEQASAAQKEVTTLEGKAGRTADEEAALKKARDGATAAENARQAALTQAQVARLRAAAARTGTTQGNAATGNADAKPAGAADVNANAATATAGKYDKARMELDSLQLPIGWDAAAWKSAIASWQTMVLTLIGWLITAFAATLGAPFWFDVLNKVMVIRSTVKPYEKSKPEASEDRQPPTQAKTQGTS